MPKIRIFITEDEQVVALDISNSLTALGYEIAGQTDRGEDAVNQAGEMRPDLILMDVSLKGEMDGIEAATQIWIRFDIPIIFLTAFSDQQTLERAHLAKPQGYLLKPFNERELATAIEMAIYKHEAERKLRLSEARYALAVQATNDGIWDWDLITDEIFYSLRWQTMLGLDEKNYHVSPEDWLGQVHPEDRDRLRLAMNAHLQGLTPTLECEYRIMHQSSGYRWMLCRGLALFDDQAKPYRMAGSQSDIHARRQLENQLIRKTLYDELTNLPNRTLFMDRLNIVLEQAHNHRNKRAAILFLDIDNFKTVNDSLGHANGDALLVAFTQRLLQCIRPGDTASRFGGDEFAVLVTDILIREEAEKVANRIYEDLQKPFFVDGQEVFSNASVGVVFTTDNYRSAEDLLMDADIAMRYSKRDSQSRYEIFHLGMREHVLNRLQQEREIRCALKNNEFILHYQPVFALETMQVDGFEALIRWQHPTRGLLGAAEFIDVAEQSGLIIPIGEWVLRTACVQAQAWNNRRGKPLRMAVNLSALQMNDKKLIEHVRSALSESGLTPDCLNLELTETTALQDVEHTVEILQSLRQLGPSIAFDDFGKGYSSLDYVKNLPGDFLKIDQSFIKNLSESGNEAEEAIVLAMITMAHQLHLKVIAEGVESETQLKLLSKMNCDQVQGFHIGKPVTAQDAVALLIKPGNIRLR